MRTRRRVRAGLMAAGAVSVLVALTAGCGSSRSAAPATGTPTPVVTSDTSPATPTPATVSATLVDSDPAPLATRAVAALVDHEQTASVRLHDTVTARVTAVGGTVHVRAVDLPPGWQLDPAPALPVAVLPGSPLTLTARLVGTGGRGLRVGTLTVHTDLPGAPATLTLPLGGFEQPTDGGASEPSLLNLLTVFGWGPPLSSEGRDVAGFLPLDPTEPVTVTVLAAFVRPGTAAPVAWRAFTAPEADHTSLLTLNPADTQTLLPRNVAGAPATATFTPGGPFAVIVNGQDTTDTRNLPRPNCSVGCSNRVVNYPVVVNGAEVPGAYVLGFDYFQGAPGTGITSDEQANGDDQDAVLLLQNVALDR